MFELDYKNPVSIGRQGENRARLIEWNVAPWQRKWPNATIQLLVQRAGDTVPYIANTEVVGGVLQWSPNSGDTARVGSGAYELQARLDDVVVKSTVGETYCARSLSGATAEAPDPYADYLQQLQEAAENANTAAETANSAAAAAGEACEEVRTDLDAMSQELAAAEAEFESGKAVLNARIDNIIANNADSDGNTELIDIRTAYDGTVYDTAGAAVRGQVNQLSEEIVDAKSVTNTFETDTLNVPYSDVGYLTVGGTIAKDVKAGNTGYVLIKGYEKLSVYTRISSSAYAVAFFDRNKILLDDISILGNDYEQTYNIELKDETYRNVVYVIASHYDFENAKFRASNATNIYKELDDKANYIDLCNVNANFDISGYVMPNGGFSSDKNASRTDYIKINGANKIKAKLNISSGGYAIAYFDEHVKFLSDISVLGNGYMEYDIDIPASAYYVVFSEYGHDANYRQAQLIKDSNVQTQIDNLYKLISPCETASFSAFRKFGIIGDSLSVGYTHNPITGVDVGRNIYYSWGQYMARKNGNTCLNFGVSGATVKSWYNNDLCYGEFIKPENLTQCYIIALGANDAENLINYQNGIGEADDIGTDADSFYGWYSKLVHDVNELNPHAKVFLFTLPYPRNTNANVVSINEAIRTISESPTLSNVYLVDLSADYDDYFKNDTISKALVNGHYTAAGYSAISRANEMALSDVMDKHINDFMSIPFIPYGSNDVIN